MPFGPFLALGGVVAVFVGRRARRRLPRSLLTRRAAALRNAARRPISQDERSASRRATGLPRQSQEPLCSMAKRPSTARRARHRAAASHAAAGRASTAASCSSTPPRARSRPASCATARSLDAEALDRRPARRCSTTTRASASASASASPTSGSWCASLELPPDRRRARSSRPRSASRPRTRSRCRSTSAVLDFQPLGIVDTAERPAPARRARRRPPRHGRQGPRTPSAPPACAPRASTSPPSR